VHPWDSAEFGQFLDYATVDRLGALYELLAMTGLRRGEALGLTWDDVDFDDGHLIVCRETRPADGWEGARTIGSLRPARYSRRDS